MDRGWPTELYSGIELSIRAEQVQVGLAVITLAGLVYLRLSENYHCRPELVPFELDFVALEKGLLRDWGREFRDIEDFHCSWLTLGRRKSASMLFEDVRSNTPNLALRNEDGH